MHVSIPSLISFLVQPISTARAAGGLDKARQVASIGPPGGQTSCFHPGLMQAYIVPVARGQTRPRMSLQAQKHH
jgi:hypothetical protein